MKNKLSRKIKSGIYCFGDRHEETKELYECTKYVLSKHSVISTEVSVLMKVFRHSRYGQDDVETYRNYIGNVLGSIGLKNAYNEFLKTVPLNDFNRLFAAACAYLNDSVNSGSDFDPDRDKTEENEVLFEQYDDNQKLIDKQIVYKGVYYLGCSLKNDESEKIHGLVRIEISDSFPLITKLGIETNTVNHYAADYNERQTWGHFIDVLTRTGRSTTFMNDRMRLTDRKTFLEAFSTVMENVIKEVG